MLYAELPARRALQVTSDVLMALWLVLWLWLGNVVREATLQLAAPGRALQTAGEDFAGRMREAARSLADLPLLPDSVATPFDSAAGAGTSLAQAGSQLTDAAQTLSWVLAGVTAGIPIAIVGAFWLWRRLRFVRTAAAAQRFIDTAQDLDLFALRAIAHQPMERLAAISADPVGAWRRGDQDVIRALGQLELRDSGLRGPEAVG